MYYLFNDGNIALSRKEENKNFIQSSIIYCVELTLRILKNYGNLIMKRSEVPLKNMYDIVAIYIVLHNLYIINNEGIEDEYIVEGENKLAKNINMEEIQKILNYGKN